LQIWLNFAPKVGSAIDVEREVENSMKLAAPEAVESS